MRPENKRLKAYLQEHGIDCTPCFLWQGSMRGSWRLKGKGAWTLAMARRLTALGFVDNDGQPLGRFSGNGGAFQVVIIQRGRIQDEWLTGEKYRSTETQP